MNPDTKRRLAAIMFTDIVGYTLLMQESESGAANIRDRHRKVFEQFHKTYHGTILQYYGDGTLSIFDSSVDAVHCAIAIQQELQSVPIVPLRIGIHMGDIVVEEKDVYGDGVNVASRVESMGVPGSVLFSEDVQKQVKNQEIDTIPLGMFEMKNVVKPMHVYAVKAPSLRIPQAGEMQGNAKLLKPPATQRWLRFASIGFLALVLGAILFWAVGLNRPGQADLLSEEVREAKVGVAVFENYTNDPNLDALGFLASEWITSSLREIGIKTVAPEMIRQYKDYIGILPNNPEGKTSFAEITQTQYLVSGSYFAQGDSVRLNIRLLNAINGEEIQTFPVLWKRKDQKEALVEEARQQLMGYWAMKNNQHFPKVNPPAYEAYQRFLDCTPGDYNCYLDVLRKDSTFILAHVSLMSAAVWMDNDSLFQASRSFVEQHWDRCTQYEKNYYQHALAFWDGNFRQSFDYYEANYQLDTMNIIMLHESAYSASIYLNRPDIAVKRYNRVFADYETFREHLWSQPFYHYANALNRNGQSERLIEFVQQISMEDWGEKADTWAWFELYHAYLNTGQLERAITYVDTMSKWVSTGHHKFLVSKAAYIWSAFHHDTLRNPFHEQIRSHLNKYPEAEKLGAGVLWSFYNEGAPIQLREYQPYLLQDWEEAEQQMSQLKIDPPTFMGPGDEIFTERNREVFAVWIEGMLGSIYARQGKHDLAMRQVEILDHLQETFPPKHTPTFRGIIPYDQAKILALLGNKDQAVAHLKQALQEGKPIFAMSFLIDYDLASLRGYAPFEALLRPRGPNFEKE